MSPLLGFQLAQQGVSLGGGAAAGAGLLSTIGGPLALAGMGFQFANMMFGGDTTQASQTAYSNAYNSTFQNLMIDQANRQRRDTFARQIDQYKTQKGFNADAANRAYVSEQRRLNEVFTQAAFRRQGMMQNLVESQGYNNAMERYGSSARRANLVGTLGEFGRQQATMAESLSSARTQSRANELDIGRQHLSADFQGWQGVAIPPMMEANVPTPSLPRSSGMNQALMIGNALGSAVQTGWNLTAPGSSLFGFKKFA